MRELYALDGRRTGARIDAAGRRDVSPVAAGREVAT
jgi:hypothetical protein